MNIMKNWNFYDSTINLDKGWVASTGSQSHGYRQCRQDEAGVHFHDIPLG